MVPDDLRYTEKHEWIRLTDSGTVRIGITDYAQDALGDVVFIQLPDTEADLAAGEPLGEVESTKSVSDIYAPLAGTVVATNSALETSPELVNSDPYGEGWIVEIRPADAGVLDGLLDADAYTALTKAD